MKGDSALGSRELPAATGASCRDDGSSIRLKHDSPSEMEQLVVWMRSNLVIVCLGILSRWTLADDGLKSSVAPAETAPAETAPAETAPVENRPTEPSSDERGESIEVLPPGLTADQIADLLEDLDSSEFRKRQSATRRLKAVSESAIPLLVKTAEQGDLETTSRIVQVLRFSYPKMNSLGDSASEALERLSRSPDKDIAKTADRVLTEYHEIRNQRALAEIRTLNGRVRYQPSVGTTNGELIAYIILVEDWSGGDRGLEYLRRLSSLRVLYVVNGAKVSEKALEQLYDRFPGLRIQFRGSAYLGISCERTPVVGNGCVVTSVEEGSAAEQAGLVEFDVIRGFDGTTVTNFDHLIKQIMTKNGGDEVLLEIERRGLPMKLKCKLGTWSEIDAAK